MLWLDLIHVSKRGPWALEWLKLKVRTTHIRHTVRFRYSKVNLITTVLTTETPYLLSTRGIFGVCCECESDWDFTIIVALLNSISCYAQCHGITVLYFCISPEPGLNQFRQWCQMGRILAQHRWGDAYRGLSSISGGKWAYELLNLKALKIPHKISYPSIERCKFHKILNL